MNVVDTRCSKRTKLTLVFIYSEEDMKVAANFLLEFVQPEYSALRYLSRAISENYLQSMPVFKHTLLREGKCSRR